MSIEIANETTFRIDEAEFSALARWVLDQMHLNPLTEVSLTFVDEAAMTDLHVRWMDEPGPTDVLSFPMDELRPGTLDETSPEGLLGDVVICPSFAENQARQAGHSAVEEMMMLTTHGLLHLMGYDHLEPDDEQEMFALQRQLLLTFLADRR